MFINILLFALGLLLLIKGGDWFVDGASGIARKFHLPEILIGATIVSIGTTLPEVMVSTTSAFEGHGQLAYGNAVGSIICNTALIAAITIAIKPGKTDKKSMIIPLSFFFGSAILFIVVAYTQREFSRVTGIILLLLFVLYTVISAITMKSGSKSSSGDIEEDSKDDLNISKISGENNPSKYAIVRFWKGDSFLKDLIFLIIGAAFIAFGARLLVNNGTAIAEKAGVPETVIALTFVALGTSLPELVTAITSLVKGHSNLSLGNIIGANLFNIVLVTGVSATVNPFELPETTTLFGIPSSLVLDLPLMLAVMAIMTLPALFTGKMYRIQGIGLLLIYAVFCVLQFVM